MLGGLDVATAQGLSAAEAAARRDRYGPNRLREHQGRSLWDILIAQFRGLIVLLLGAAAGISIAFGETEEAIAIVAVILINAAIGFITEMRAVRSMAALRQLGTVEATVRRDGHPARIPAEDLVPGDIMLLEGGDVIAADLRLVTGHGLQCDESALTGESVPVAKDPATLAADTPLADRVNMGFKGTAVTRGEAEGVVIATGMDTELGRISALVEQAEEEDTTLEARLDQLGGQLVKVTLALVAMIALSGMLTGRDPLEMVQTAIALAVAAVPEGLPIVATLALARGMWRMAERNALIENLAAVETLGSTTVIFTDKTGTLTENRMTVVRLALTDGDVAVAPGGDTPFTVEGGARDASAPGPLRRALEICVLCNSATLPDSDAPDARGIGDPMEVALLAAGAKAGLARDGLCGSYPEVSRYAFDPDRQMMASAHRDGDAALVAVKGSPPAVLACATRVAGADGIAPLDAAGHADWLARNDALAAEGLRVLALAYRDAPVDGDDPYADLVLVGLCCLEDPPRSDVTDAISACRGAGVRVVMVTGDQVATARSIAGAVGIGDGDIPAIETGDLKPPDAMNDDDRDAAFAARVFARVSPEQKLNLVDLYQDRGEIVAMTGDGVNDAPALTKADIGIAMGLRGTQVAREAADMVLRDDAFGSIVAAMRQGRIIFGNIRAFVLYLLSCNLSEILIVWIGAISGLPLPLLPLQILFLNLVTDVFPAFALGAGEGSGAVMRQPPRDPAEPVVTRRHWMRIAAYGGLITVATLTAFGIALGVFGHDPAAAVTVSFLTLAFAQLWHVFNMADPDAPTFDNEVTRNPWVWGSLALCIGLLLAALHVPVLADVLKLTPPSAQDWGLILGCSLMPLVLARGAHWFSRHRKPAR